MAPAAGDGARATATAADAPPRTRAHRRELLESREEILIGEVIAGMAEAGWPVVGIASDVDYQRIRFLAVDDAVLYAAVVAVNRIAPSATSAVIEIEAELRDDSAAPDEVLSRRAELSRMLRERARSEVSLRQEPGSIFASTRRTVALDDLDALIAGGSPQRAAPTVTAVVHEAIAALRAVLAPGAKTT